MSTFQILPQEILGEIFQKIEFYGLKEMQGFTQICSNTRKFKESKMYKDAFEKEKSDFLAIMENSFAIQHIKNPSEAVQIAVIKKHIYNIRFIDKPSEAVQIAAVKINGSVIEFIKNPSEAVQLAAVKQNGCAIVSIANPSEAVQIAAVFDSPKGLIQYGRYRYDNVDPLLIGREQKRRAEEKRKLKKQGF